MVEQNVESRQPSSLSQSSPQEVVDLLTSILKEVRSQVLLKTPIPTPPPLTGAALTALDLFAEIGAALALQPLPTITLTASSTQLPVGGGTATLTWTSTAAQTVSIDHDIGDVTPVAGGSKDVFVSSTTTVTATARGPCGPPSTSSATVNVEFVA